MPTPVGHSLAGATLYLAFTRGARPLAEWPTALLCVASATAADLDFLAGAATGQWNRFHQGISHSLTVALALSLVLACLPLESLGAWVRRFWLFTALTVSHLALDVFTRDTRPPYGIPLLWPFSPVSIHASLEVFPNVRRDSVAAMLSPTNWRAVAVEMLVLAPFLVAVGVYRLRAGRDAPLP